MQRQHTQSIAPVFARRFRWHLVWIFLKSGILLFLLGGFVWAMTTAYLVEGKAGFAAAFAWAAFLYFLVAFVFGLRDTFRVCLLPYFERRLGGIDTFARGKSLLSHSRNLDEIARQLAVRPLSDFASGDDMVWFERLVWHDPKEALQTAERLLDSGAAQSFPQELKDDLHRLKIALAAASAQNVRFCLLLREGSYTSGLEMDRRKGSFF